MSPFATYGRYMTIDYNKYILSPSESSKWGVISVIVGGLVYAICNFIGLKNKAFYFALLAGAILITIRLRSDILRKTWFWVVILFFIILHYYLIMFIPNDDASRPGILMFPVVFIDIFVMFHVLTAIESALRGHDQH